MGQPADFETLESTIAAIDGYRPKGPFPLFIKDLKEDTIGWEGAARWRYLCVLEHMFHKGGYIPDDLAYLAEISGTNRARNWRETLEKLRYILLKSDEKPGFLTNKRVLIEVEKANKRSGIARKGGKAKATKKPAVSTISAVLPTPTPKERKKEGYLSVSQERKKRRTQLPLGWTLLPDQRQWADAKASEACVVVDWDQEAEQFADHHRKLGNSMTCWKAAWRTWGRNAIKFKLEKTHGNRRYGNGAGRPSPHDTLLAAGAWAAIPRHERGEGGDPEPDGGPDQGADETAPGIPRVS